ncbi:hypothetical protein F2Q70_00003358 [Brassica cretica]|uniref:Agenet domain-containing protein n=1 Tax=Brassica cretica TaxID=69181 RepID=A0A8S9IMT3_BRACR|nr:hypothetical protein F2Q70_00003358 [Brassica cretica]
MNEATFRAIPPEHGQVGIIIKVGSIVDADQKGMWWTGLLVKQIGGDNYLALFNSPPEIIPIAQKHLRPHRFFFSYFVAFLASMRFWL